MATTMKCAIALGVLLLAGAIQVHAQNAQAPQQECDKAAAPGDVAAVKANVVDDKTVDVMWLPPQGNACFEYFVVSGKNTKTGATLKSETVKDALSATFDNLSPGSTYEFTVHATGPGGKGPSSKTRAAMPPAYLDVKPETPEAFKAVAASDTSAKLSWTAPAGNPKVDEYSVLAVPVNATGYPTGGKNLTFTADGKSTSKTVTGLSASSYYVFTIAAKNSKGSSDIPGLSFLATPAPGQTEPAAPADVSAIQAGNGVVALKWQPPAGSSPDYYQIGITEVDAAGKPMSATNVIPYKNTTALIRDLTPGATYQFNIQSYSASYDSGKSSQIQYTLPASYSAPAQAPAAAPANLKADIVGNEVQLTWQTVPGANAYTISAYDGYSGRNLGIDYSTQSNSIKVPGLPMGQPVQLVVTGTNGNYYSEPATVTVEIPAAQQNYPADSVNYNYYDSGYSPYYGYNPYMPYWYSSYYPIGYYDYWYPGKWVVNGVLDFLTPWNNYWGFGWWNNRPGGWNPPGPIGGWGWGWNSWGNNIGWGINNWNKPGGWIRSTPYGGNNLANINNKGDLLKPGNKLPGQKPITKDRPQTLPEVVRPTNKLPTNKLPGDKLPGNKLPDVGTKLPGASTKDIKPSNKLPEAATKLPGSNTKDLTPSNKLPEATTKLPAATTKPGLADASGRPATTLPSTKDLKPAPGSIGGGASTLPSGVSTLPSSRPTTMPTTRPSTLPSTTMPTTRPSTTMSTTRPTTTMPTTRPTTTMPTTRPTMPTTRPTTTMPTTRPSMPTSRPSMPTSRPSVQPMPLDMGRGNAGLARGGGGGGGAGRGGGGNRRGML